MRLKENGRGRKGKRHFSHVRKKSVTGASAKPTMEKKLMDLYYAEVPRAFETHLVFWSFLFKNVYFKN